MTIYVAAVRCVKKRSDNLEYGRRDMVFIFCVQMNKQQSNVEWLPIYARGTIWWAGRKV